MDRPLDPHYRKKRLARRALIAAAALLLTAGLFVWAPGWIRPSVSRARIRTARVERGSLEATLSAAGTVVPEFEQVLSSPVESRVLRILKRPGATLRKGEPILELDVSASVLALDKINQELAIKENQQAKKKLDLKNNLDGLQSQYEIKRLDHQTFKASVAQNRQLLAQGVIAADTVRQAELQEAKAALELQQLAAAQRNAQEATKTEIAGLDLEIQTLQKEREEAARQLHLATTTADRDGVLTWVVAQEGVTVHQGDVLARLADLRSFRIDATVSDVHAKRLAAGLPVQVKIGEEYLAGTVTNILPTVENGVITCAIGLADKASPLLRPNLRVDVLIVTDRKEGVLKIRKGAFANGEGAQDLFVVRGDAALRTRARLGLASFEHYEVEGLVEGDEVIISDMKEYAHLREVKLY